MGQMMGYARVSTPEQDVSLQRDALHQVGCREEHVFLDIASGARIARPGLAACPQALAPGDTLVVWRVDRLGRSMTHLVTLLDELLRRQIRFRSLCDGALDTTTAAGELVFHIFSALAQFERRLSQERTQAGLTAARARGRHGGRRPITADDPRVRMATAMYTEHSLTCAEIWHTLGISRATFYRYVTLGRQGLQTTGNRARDRSAGVTSLPQRSGARPRVQNFAITIGKPEVLPPGCWRRPLVASRHTTPLAGLPSGADLMRRTPLRPGGEVLLLVG